VNETVPATVKPPVVPFPSAGLLPGIPSQPSAEQEAVRRSVDAQFPLVAQLVNDGQTTEQPKTWTFTDRDTDKPLTVTCVPGCVLDHSHDIGQPRHPGDIWCETPREDVTLPVNHNGTPEEFRVLGVSIKVMPFSNVLAERLPYACIEMVDDHWVEPLDPDGLETVISTLAVRLDLLRETHAELVRVRARQLAVMQEAGQ